MLINYLNSFDQLIHPNCEHYDIKPKIINLQGLI